MAAFGLPAGGTPQGAALLKSDILGVFAHPDDETGMAATLARYALGEGKVVAAVYATRGEGGGNMVGTQSGPALGILREAELRRCLQTLGVRSCYFLDQTDFFYTESLAATFRKWNHDEALARLVRLVRALRPEIIVTMNPAPNPGQHGHHQAAAVLATEAFDAAADPHRFPEQIAEEGLEPWQVRRLFYGGEQGSRKVAVTTTDRLQDGRPAAEVAGAAMAEHRSQAFGNAGDSPWMRRPQVFSLMKTVVSIPIPKADLLEGLPLTGPAPALEMPPPAARPVIAFRPRPAIARYLQWVAEQHLPVPSAGFPADIPVVAGAVNPVELEVREDATGVIDGHLSWGLPTGWRVVSATRERRGKAAGNGLLRCEVEVPPDAREDVSFEARASWRGTNLQAQARLHPVPFGRVPRLRKAPSLAPDGKEEGWGEACQIHIGSDDLWQGHADGPADCSADVRVAHAEGDLFVEVRVHDDVVVSNIEPNDIRGHWRTDSVEICIDPASGSEETTGCFKLGIIPFDTTGAVRAARDADANQGPLETTAPDVKVVSRRTVDGYVVRAEIPLRRVGARLGRSPRLGFNVLVYDGDKEDAARGENINECRIAWAPRAGVQGRPEDWGRIELQ